MLSCRDPNEIDGIRVFDRLGRQVEAIGHSAINSSVTIGSSLSPNMYFVKVYGTDWTKTFKVVKY
jgi:hypothetical protein